MFQQPLELLYVSGHLLYVYRVVLKEEINMSAETEKKEFEKLDKEYIVNVYNRLDAVLDQRVWRLR